MHLFDLLFNLLQHCVCFATFCVKDVVFHFSIIKIKKIKEAFTNGCVEILYVVLMMEME